MRKGSATVRRPARSVRPARCRTGLFKPGTVPRPIAFDLSRLYLGALGRTPRGIDRVDLGFARRLFDDPARRDVGLVPSPARMGVLPAASARRVTDRVERHWREGVAVADDGRGEDLRRWLAGGPVPPTSAARAGVSRLPWHLAPMLAAARGSGLSPAARHVPQGAVYLNTGQVLLGFPWCFGWLDRRPDVRPVFLIHDVIPLRFPEYAGPVLRRHHARAVANAARRAAGLLATSHAAAAEVRDALRPLGRATMPIHVAPLPVSPSLLAPAAALPPEGCYFVSVGIMDQRKNYGLLLRVWRDLVRAGGTVPKLAIIGAHGLRTAGLHDLIARSPGLSSAVVVASGLPSAVMRDILRGARALLMPSFAEGFGLPLIEAQALGVAVVASDIPAHREVGGPGAVYLDPLDGPGWRREIVRLGQGSGPPAPHEPASPETWPRYVDGVLPFLDSL